MYLTSTTVTSTATTTYTTGTSTVVIVIPTTTVIQSFAKRSYPGINPNDPAGLFHDTPLARRDLTVPAYASPCSSVARFASACSCAFGIFPTTVIVSTTLPAQVCYPLLTKIVLMSLFSQQLLLLVPPLRPFLPRPIHLPKLYQRPRPLL